MKQWIIAILLCIASKGQCEEDASERRLRPATLRGSFTSSQEIFDDEYVEFEDNLIRRELSAPEEKKKKSPVNDLSKQFLKRVVLQCDRVIDLENCWEQISHMGENFRLVHKLERLHSIAVENDESSIQDLNQMGFTFSEDMERAPLVLEGSLRYHRALAGQEVSYSLDMIRATNVWEQYKVQGEGVRVCIMDTGLYADHPDFQESQLTGWDSADEFVTPWNEDELGHGTHITGIVAASDNDRGYIGVAPGVEVYFIRVFTRVGKFYGSDIAAAGEACKKSGADIISMSLGGRGYDKAESEMFRDLFKEGIIAVASAGNTGGPELMYPAGYEHVISVAACDEKKKLANYSTFNSFVDIAAPGTDIPSTYIDLSKSGKEEVYATLSGTSMAVPHVTGVLALMKSYKPSATSEELLTALLQSTQSLATNVDLGLLDAFAAVKMLNVGGRPSGAVPRTCTNIELVLKTDDHGEETAYRLRRMSDNVVLWKGIGLESSKKYKESTCVNPNDCYEFIIRDTFGDGILEPGSITLTYANRVEVNDGNFGRGGKILLGDAC